MVINLLEREAVDWMGRWMDRQTDRQTGISQYVSSLSFSGHKYLQIQNFLFDQRISC